MARDKKKPGATSESAEAKGVARGVEQGLAAIGARLDDLVTRVSDTALNQKLDRAVTKEVRRAAEEAQRDVLRTAETLLKADDEARRRTLQAIDALVSQQADRLDQVSRRAADLDERLSNRHVSELIERAVASSAATLLTERFDPQLERIAETYDQVDDRLERLKVFIEEFGPGGAPVLHQEVQAQRARIETLEADLQAARSDAAEQRRRAEDLDAERLKRRARSGLSAEELAERLERLEALDRDLADREALTAERDRLDKRVAELREQLAIRTEADAAERQERVDRERLARVELALRDADRHREESENEKLALRRRLNHAEDEKRALRDRLEELGAEQAAAQERHERIGALEGELQEYSRLYEGAEAKLSQLRMTLEQERVRSGELFDRVEQLRSEAAVAEAAWRADKEDEHREFLQQRQVELERWAQNHASNLMAAERARLSQLEATVERLEGERSQLRSSLDESRADNERSAAKLEAEQLRFAALESELEERRARLDKDAEEALSRRQELLERDADSIRETAAEEGRRAKEQAEEEARHLTQLADAEQVRLTELDEARLAIEGVVTDLEARKGVLEEELELARQKVEDLRERTLPREERIQSLLQPVFSAEDLPEVATPGERDWLDRLHRDIGRAGFTFHRRLLDAFHTSLKIADQAPLVVLAGISGTGKSQLPRLYADLGGLPFLPLAVQPSWDSPHDLFGFFNYTDGRLKAEQLARLLRQVGDGEDALRKSPCLVLLDEMNLARVEYYFAELLSKLEARRGLDPAAGAAERLRASVEIDAGPGEPTVPLYLDERILFVGTMNEDESTLTLSDKVLDRACVLTFPAPRDMELKVQEPPPRPSERLSWETWRSWRGTDTTEEVTERLNEINRAMEALSRPFGHRLFRAIHSYVGNHPGGAESADAWSDQFAMKIIPRLRGLECDAADVRAGLEQLQRLVPEDLHEAFERARGREFFTWVGAPELYRIEG